MSFVHLFQTSPNGDCCTTIKEVSASSTCMGGPAVCDFPGCGEEGIIVSRLSPEGYLVATGKKAYSFREAYRRVPYIRNHQGTHISGVWYRVG